MPFYPQEWLASLSDAQYHLLNLQQTSFGYHPTTHDEFYVSNGDRFSSTYILGVPGGGKSGLLDTLTVADMHALRSVIVIDPHGDLINNLLHHVPAFRELDTFVLDMEDEAHPFGVNLFNTGTLTTDIARSAAVARIEHIFEVLWPDVLSQANLPRYLRMAILVFLANPGRTLVDMYSFFLDDAFRRQLLQAVADPTVKQFWQVQYDNLPPANRISRVQPLLGRLEQLFAGRSLVRNIVGQQNSIDFRQVIEHQQNIFIKLPLQTAEQDARLIGTILLSQIHAALFSFINVPEDKRPGVSLYLDEFQNFATTDIEELFSQGRKFGMRLTVAHQNRGQLPAFLHQPTIGARTKVCFQLTHKDGAEMAHGFPVPEASVKPEHVDPHASETLVNHPHLHPTVVQEFIEAYLRPVLLQQVGSHGNKVRIADPGYGLADAAGDFMFTDYDDKRKTRYELPEAENPLVYLDYLLQQVMVTGLYLMPIPAVAVRGFANCGISFWQKVRWMSDKDRCLAADIPELTIPDYLLARLPDGSYAWTRQPETATEQLLHFLYHLRITMRYLAEHPLGSKTTVSNAEVAKMLNSLPKRAAFVRSGETVGVIYTPNTPGKLPEREYGERVKAIRDHTRKTYCRPRAEVEQTLLGTQAVPPAQQPVATPPPVAPTPASLAVPTPPVPVTNNQQGSQASFVSPTANNVQPVLSGWEEAEP